MDIIVNHDISTSIVYTVNNLSIIRIEYRTLNILYNWQLSRLLTVNIVAVVLSGLIPTW